MKVTRILTVIGALGTVTKEIGDWRIWMDMK